MFSAFGASHDSGSPGGGGPPPQPPTAPHIPPPPPRTPPPPLKDTSGGPLQARQLLALMHPRVYDTTSTITFANAEIVEVLFCLNGRFGGSGAEGGGGAVLGVEEAAAGRTGWPLTLRAHTRVDMWALPMESLRAHIKSNEKLRSAFCKGIPQAMARGFGVESEWAVVNAPPKSRALS